MRYNSIIYNDLENGKGMRISLFVQGCSCKCKGCFNTESWNFNKGYEFTQKELDTIMFVLKTYSKQYDGISLLGGNPTDNLDLCNFVIDTFRKEFGQTKDIWVWSGHTWEQILSDKDKLNMIQKCDILVDGKFEQDLYNRNLLFRGSSNQRIIDIQQSLKQQKIILWKE